MGGGMRALVQATTGHMHHAWFLLEQKEEGGGGRREKDRCSFLWSQKNSQEDEIITQKKKVRAVALIL